MTIQPLESKPPAVPMPASGMAIAGLVLGITSIVFCWWGLGSLAQSVLAITFAANGIKRANAGLAGGRSMAVAGLACGIVGFFAYLTVGIATLGVGFII